MIQIPAYRVEELIDSTEHMALYRVIHIASNDVFLAKTINSGHAGINGNTDFIDEYNRLVELQGLGVVTPVKLEHYGDRVMMLLQDDHWTTLQQLYKSKREMMRLDELLDVACAIVECVQQLHQQRVMINQLIPAHLVINNHLTTVKLVDIQLSVTASTSYEQSIITKRPASVLPYLSPEQTGRTGLVPDFRSDLYSVGVILYQWFAGQLPFQSEKMVDIVYEHIATKEEPLYIKNSAIPRMVSDIIAKCMEKMPEARYVTASSIIADLNECIAQLRITGKIQRFSIGARDTTNRIYALNDAFDRQEEQRYISEVVRRVAESKHSELLWISGDSGQGITYLVNDTLRKVVPAEAYFVMNIGNNTNQDYGIWLRVIEQLILYILSFSQYQLERWKAIYSIQLQDDMSVLVRYIPRLQLLMDKQLDREDLEFDISFIPIEDAISHFLEQFLRDGQQLVIFIDQMHAADQCSVQFLMKLLQQYEQQQLLIIGSYQENNERIETLINTYKEHPAMNFSFLALYAYDVTDLKQRLIQYFVEAVEHIDELVKVIMDKTDGNPMYVKQYVQLIVDQQLIKYNERRRTWVWKSEIITALHVHDQVAATITETIHSLADQDLYLLTRAAFLGNQFHIDTLAAITQSSSDEIDQWLNKVKQNRYIHSVTNELKVYRFQHEEIYNQVYHAVPQTTQMKLHAEIGWKLVDQRVWQSHISLKDALHHLNKAATYISDEDNIIKLVQLNMEVCQEAQEKLLSSQALHYIQYATYLVEHMDWSSSLKFAAYMQHAEVAFLNNCEDEARKLCNLLLQNGSSNEQRLQVYLLLIKMLSSQERHEDVVEYSKKIFELLQFQYNFKPTSIHIASNWLAVLHKVKKQTIDKMLELPPMNDENMHTILKTLHYLSRSYFSLDLNKWVYSVFCMMKITMDHGLTAEAAYGFSGYALIKHFHWKDYKESYEWGKLACTISYASPAIYIEVATTISLCYLSWNQYDPSFIQRFFETLKNDKYRGNDIILFNQVILVNATLLFLDSFPMLPILMRLNEFTDQFIQRKGSVIWQETVTLCELLATLTCTDKTQISILVENGIATAPKEELSVNDIELLAPVKEICNYIIAYLSDDYVDAKKYIDKLLYDRTKSSLDFLGDSSHHYYNVLVLKELIPRAEQSDKLNYMKELKASTKELNKLSKISAKLCNHKYFLAVAECAKMSGDYERAEHYYYMAVEHAKLNNFTHDVAIISECFALYAMKQSKSMLAKVNINEAYNNYERWGAILKTRQFNAKYGHMLNTKEHKEVNLEEIDYMSIMNSVQILSGEMEMNSLLPKLMEIMFQNSGAEYGALLLRNEEAWNVEIYGMINKLSVESIPLAAAEKYVPISIINYVARTEEVLILDHAVVNEHFARDLYVVNNRLKSVICLPIIQQNSFICLLYLENNLSLGVFNNNRQDVLKILSSQCAISIENAGLYSDMQYLKNSLEEQVDERTKDLERSMEATSEAIAEMTVYEERSRIAQEIHDIVGHTLTSTIVQIEVGKRMISKDKEDAASRLTDAQELVRHSLKEIRNSVHMLKEDKYYDIKKALHKLIVDAQHNTEVVIHSRIDELENTSLLQKKLLYHALQEGITNGVRHGKASQFHITISNDEMNIRFVLIDDGIGSSEVMMGFGLKMMNDRVRQMKGSLRVESEPHKGFMLSIELPCNY